MTKKCIIRVMNGEDVVIVNVDDPEDITQIKDCDINGKHRVNSEIIEAGDGTWDVSKFVSNPDCIGGVCPIR